MGEKTKTPVVIRDVTEREQAKFFEIVSTLNGSASFFKVQGNFVTRLNNMNSKSPVRFVEQNTLSITEIECMVDSLQALLKIIK